MEYVPRPFPKMRWRWTPDGPEYRIFDAEPEGGWGEWAFDHPSRVTEPQARRGRRRAVADDDG